MDRNRSGRQPSGGATGTDCVSLQAPEQIVLNKHARKKASVPRRAPRARRTVEAVVPAPAPPPRQHILLALINFIKALWQSTRKSVTPLLQPRSLRKLELLEMQQLGDKRFVAIVRVGDHRYLIGGGASSVMMLAEVGAHLPKPEGEQVAQGEPA